MYLIVCVDDRLGMAFNRRRQSMDSLLRRKLLRLVNGRPLWMRAYTARQFEEEEYAHLKVDEHYLQLAAADEFCFVELDDILPFSEQIQGILLCRWNRTYPADTFLRIPGNADDWEITVTDEFAGSSHEKITIEFWRKK